jgi:hypothetical protein
MNKIKIVMNNQFVFRKYKYDFDKKFILSHKEEMLEICKKKYFDFLDLAALSRAYKTKNDEEFYTILLMNLGWLHREKIMTCPDSITIPNSIKKIDSFTFSDCRDLVSVVLPNSIISIEEYAFNNCVSLTTINIPKFVKLIDRNAFKFCVNLKYIKIPKDCVVYPYAFHDCKVKRY